MLLAPPLWCFSCCKAKLMVLGFEWYKDFNGIGTFLIILFYFISFVLGSDREFAFIHSFAKRTTVGLLFRTL